ncbi:metalloregulator ArsR/SmtB family transcription factor [Demequina capsici]|uniref:Metalloregulator ArsR/SmtB family transcription factor n=1 Tax=Demequina capsici TaxID=3075620 RepID=A0AA96F720_9MICO|nr:MULTISPECIES: metalloregulator ArsR/SmtB family transcription factor [unclassified Demequina]WNM24323.1 metalloregulator ArsR/SmtB family transcription factor [Demequina sp. OYTSA14]WNM27145.1 metalloregulator ArsR/SmtB family transcription factor [Demequina sp. PMTSA13]
MVVSTDLTDAEVDRLFHALADATRRDIVRRTLADDASVTDLAAAYAMSFAAVSKHVAVLEEAGLVTRHQDGRRRLVRADPARLARAQELLARYEQLWRHRVGRLDALLGEASPAPHPRPSGPHP